MALVTINVTTIDGVAPAKTLQAVDTKDILEMVSSTNLVGGLALVKVRRYDGRGSGMVSRLENWVASDSYATVLAAVNAADAEQGAEVLTNKATTFGTINDTLYPSTEAVFENFQPIWYKAASGTDTYTATLDPAPTAYTAGMRVHLKFANSNTISAATINLNGLGAKGIKKGVDGNTALLAADIVVGKVYTLLYDGTLFQIDIV